MKLNITRALHYLAAALALLGLLAGCGDDDGVAADPAVKQVVSAAGGSVTSADGSLVLTIPAGALGNDTEIVITEVSAAQQPDAVKALGADKVYRFEPSGLAFAAPATFTVNLPPSRSGQIAVLLVHSAGSWEWAAAQSMTVSAAGRSLSGQLSHFSEVVAKTLEGVTFTASVTPVEIAVGEQLVAEMTASKPESPWAVELDDAGTFQIAPEFGAPMLFQGTTGDGLGQRTITLDIGVARSVATRWAYRCTAPHDGTMFFGPVQVNVPVSLVSAGLFLGWVDDNRLDVTLDRPYRCKAAPTPEPEPGQSVRAGLFPLPLGMQKPDGVGVFQGPFANIGEPGPLAFVAGNNGALVIDLKTGAVVLNQTAGAPDGHLGNAPLLAALPVSAPNPGASTPAALFGTSAIGAAMRGYNLPPPAQGSFFRWGPTLLTQTQMLDAGTPGGGLVGDEAMTTVPGIGLNFYRLETDRWLQTFERVGAFNFDGVLRAAVLPQDGLGKPLLALTAGSDNNTTSTVWYHSRQPNTPAVKLFAMIPGANAARRLRCQAFDAAVAAAQAGKVLCAATEPGGSVSLFTYDPANPTATPAVTTLAVGAGATGVQFGTRANGNPWAVVANFDAHTLNVIDFSTDGTVLGNATVPVPQGCLNPPHAAPFTAAGQDYIAGTCNGSDNYFVVRYGYRF